MQTGYQLSLSIESSKRLYRVYSEDNAKITLDFKGDDLHLVVPD